MISNKKNVMKFEKKLKTVGKKMKTNKKNETKLEKK